MTKFRLARKDRRALERLRRNGKDKLEYVRATCLLMRWGGRKVEHVARELDVSMGAVFKWEAAFRRHGIEALRTKKPPGRPSVKKKEAREHIPDLMKKDPQTFGFLKGRWVVRDISKALKEEGVEISPTQVHGILNDLGLSYKRPKLTVESNDPSFVREERA
jgi:transposase